MYSKIQSVRYTKTNSFEEIVFLKKKLRMALKQEIIVKLVRIWVEHPTFWRIEKSPNRVIACFEAIQNHIKNQKNLLHIQ